MPYTQVPSLPESPPNFLVASEIFKHRKPVAVVAGEEAEEEPEPTPPPPVEKPVRKRRLQGRVCYC